MHMQISTSAVANPYLSADGFLNISAVEKTAASIDKAMAKVEDIKPTGFYAISLKAKPGAYSAAKDKKRDFKYLATRMVKVVARKRAPSAAASKTIFTQYDVKALGKELAAKQRQILSAIQRHLTKLPKDAEKIKVEKAGIREEAQKKHDAALDALTGLLTEAGFNIETNMVQSSGPFGSVTLLKVGKNEVVSIGKSDLAKFNAAKRANKSESASLSGDTAKVIGQLKKLHPKVQFEVEDADNWPDANPASSSLLVAELKGHLVYDVLKDVDASPLSGVKAAAKYWGLSEEAITLIAAFNKLK